MDIPPATIVIADNQDITCEGLHGVIKSLYPSHEVLDVSDRKSLAACLTKHPDAVVVLDYTLFDLRGFEDLLILQRRFSDVRWIFFSNELSLTLIRRILLEEKMGIVMKECSRSEIVMAFRYALNGERYICHQITSQQSGKLPDSSDGRSSSLTNAEREILIMIAKGKSVKEIASERNSSPHTIITHKKNIFRKLEVNNIYEATKYAVRTGLVELVEYYI